MKTVTMNGKQYQYAMDLTNETIEFNHIGSDQVLKVSMFEEKKYANGGSQFISVVGTGGQYISWAHWLYYHYEEMKKMERVK